MACCTDSLFRNQHTIRLELMIQATATTVNKTTMTMDIFQMMATLTISRDEARVQLEKWLHNTKKGTVFKTRFAVESSLLQAGMESEVNMDSLLSKWTGHQRYENGLPPEVADYIFGPINDKILCDSEHLKKIMLKNDPLEFALDSYVEDNMYAPVRFFSDFASFDVPDHGVTKARRFGWFKQSFYVIDLAPSKPSFFSSERQPVTLSKAFAAPFRGEAHFWFITGPGVYSTAYNGDEYHGKTTPVVQSSGTCMGEVTTHGRVGQARMFFRSGFHSLG